MVTDSDYVVAGGTFWSDDNIVDALETHQKFLAGVVARPIAQNLGGTSRYYYYQLPYTYFESESSGTAYFRLFDGYGDLIGTADYTLDPVNGQILFSDDHGGSSVYCDMLLYNVHAAAADIWRMKAGHIAAHSYNITIDGHKLNRRDVIDSYTQMADYYEGKSGFKSVPVVRVDITGV